MSVSEGQLLWSPSESFMKRSRMSHYMSWVGSECGLRFPDYEELWRWSVSDLEAFWGSLWRYFGVIASRHPGEILARRVMPGAQWFDGAELSLVENVFRHSVASKPAVIFCSERLPYREMTWDELYRAVAALARGLAKLGVRRGDRVVSYMPNIPETVIAFLATSSLGAIWSSCSPDFGARSVVERFQQIEPRVLFAVDGYRYGGREFDRVPVVAELQRSLPTLEHTVVVPYLSDKSDLSRLRDVIPWSALAEGQGDLDPVQLPFSDPLWVVYTSGTTGLPKPIVHSHGGVLIELLKSLGLHLDMRPEDTFFWFTTTGWVMWNILVVGGLLTGASIVLYDGSPAYPDLTSLWRLAERASITVFGCSPAFITSCMKEGLVPRRSHHLARLRALGSTGSPLTPEAFEWIYQSVKHDVWLASISGGTDVCSPFVGSCPLLPVYAGEIQCRYLGVNVQAYDSNGAPLLNEVGELVITEPMPSMPICFWNDQGNRRYRESYFENFPGVWCHGDWVKFTPRSTVVIYGRSDSTINRQGVRMGTSEIYNVVESMPEIVDSLVVDLEVPGYEPYLPLFVVLTEGTPLDADLEARIRRAIREQLSPRHLPDDIVAVSEVPRTLNGKKLEVPVKRILLGADPASAVSRDAMSNPESLREFIEFRQMRAATAGSVRES